MTDSTNANAGALVEVDVTNDTDLDAFSDDFFGTPQEPTETDEVTPEDVDSDDDEGDNTPDQELDEDDEPEDEDEPEPEPEPKKNRKTAKERITELVAEKKAAEAREREALRRIADFESRLAKVETPAPADPVPTPQKAATPVPDPDAVNDKGELVYPLGEFDPQYIADVVHATIQTETAKVQAEAERKAAEEAQAAEQAKLTEAWNGKLEETEKEIPDLREKLATLEDSFTDVEPNYGTYLVQTIMGLERGPEVLYYLASNTVEAQKIVAAGPVGATIALGRLEGMLPAKEVKGKSNNDKKVSKAPVPPTPTRGTGVAKVVSGDTDDLDAFAKEFFR